MRITGGKYVRRNIECPKGVIRPAMDRMRESLFAHLGPLDGESFLDLFSGSGCVAIEAASRGAKRIHLVEMDRGKKATIEKNLSFVEEEKKLFIMDVMRFIELCNTEYSMIYADPPFNMEKKVEMTERIAKRALLKEGGLFMIHYPEEERGLWKDIEGWSFIEEKKYGRSIVRIYRRNKEEKNDN